MRLHCRIYSWTCLFSYLITTFWNVIIFIHVQVSSVYSHLLVINNFNPLGHLVLTGTNFYPQAYCCLIQGLYKRFLNIVKRFSDICNSKAKHFFA